MSLSKHYQSSQPSQPSQHSPVCLCGSKVTKNWVFCWDCGSISHQLNPFVESVYDAASGENIVKRCTGTSLLKTIFRTIELCACLNYTWKTRDEDTGFFDIRSFAIMCYLFEKSPMFAKNFSDQCELIYCQEKVEKDEATDMKEARKMHDDEVASSARWSVAGNKIHPCAFFDPSGSPWTSPFPFAKDTPIDQMKQIVKGLYYEKHWSARAKLLVAVRFGCLEKKTLEEIYKTWCDEFDAENNPVSVDDEDDVDDVVDDVDVDDVDEDDDVVDELVRRAVAAERAKLAAEAEALAAKRAELDAKAEALAAKRAELDAKAEALAAEKQAHEDDIDAEEFDRVVAEAAADSDDDDVPPLLSCSESDDSVEKVEKVEKVDSLTDSDDDLFHVSPPHMIPSDTVASDGKVEAQGWGWWN